MTFATLTFLTAKGGLLKLVFVVRVEARLVGKTTKGITDPETLLVLMLALMKSVERKSFSASELPDIHGGLSS
jgi:hypothetical protein